MGLVGTIAAREIGERARSKAFLASNVFIVILLLAVVGLNVFLGGTGVSTVAVGDPASVELARAVEAERVRAGGGLVEVLELDDPDAVEAAVRAGDADLGIVDGAVLVERSVPGGLEPVVRLVARSLALEEALDQAGVPPEAQGKLLREGALDIVVLDEDAEQTDQLNVFVALGAVLSLYGLLIIYGQWVAQGIVEEKQSRVVEVVLSAVSPTQLLAGKVLGIGALGLLQVLFIASLGVGGLLIATDLPVSVDLGVIFGLVIAWFVLGFALYATLFAATGAVVSRVEDLQSASTPVVAIILGAFFAAQFALQDPTSTFAAVIGHVPFTAPLVQPIRMAAGAAGTGEVFVSALLTVVTVLALLPVVARIYAGAVLKTRGRSSLRSAYRSGGRTADR